MIIVTITGRLVSRQSPVFSLVDAQRRIWKTSDQHYRKGDAFQNNWGVHPIPRKNLKHQSIFMQPPEQAVILLAEDRDDDIVLIRRVFNKGNILNPLHVVRNGEEAIAYLRGEGEYSNRSEYPLPDDST